MTTADFRAALATLAAATARQEDYALVNGPAGGGT